MIGTNGAVDGVVDGAVDGAVKGAVTVNDTNLDGNSGQINIDGGTNITVNASGVTNGGYLSIGDQNTVANDPTGTVNVTETSASTTTTDLASSSAVSMGGMDIYGGTTVNVAEHAAASTSAATNVGDGETGESVEEGDVNVFNYNGTVTSVTVTQDAAVNGTVYSAAKAAVAATVTQALISAGQETTIDNLTFTANAGVTLTAAQVAAAFANLATGAITGSSTLGTYSGAYTGNGTGAVTTTTSGTTLAEINTPAQDAIAAIAGVMSVTTNHVYIGDKSVITGGNVTDTIANVTVANANSVVIGTTALTTLSVTNSSDVYIYHVGNATNTIATTLNATINNLTGILSDWNNQYKTMNITTAGKDSASNLSAAAITALNVSGTNAWDITGVNTTALKTVAVSGSAGVSVNVSAITAFTDFNAATTLGNNTVTINASNATYEGGSGADVVTDTSTGVSKAISLGAGNDTMVLTAKGAVTAAINGGTGTNTLSMDVNDAQTASTTVAFSSLVTNFQDLTLTGTVGKDTTDSVNLAKLGGYNYVTDSVDTTANSGAALTLMNMASNGTIAFADNTTTHTVTLDNAIASTTADTLNVAFNVAGSASDVVNTTLTDTNFTTVKIAANNTSANVVATNNTDTLTLADAAATSITVTGNAALDLTSTSTVVTSVNASANTGGLKYTTAGTTAETVHGSATAVNALTAGGAKADTLIGGSANDTFTSNAAADTMTGNGGNDTFNITAPTDSNSYSTITDFNVGDTLVFAGAASFNTTAITTLSTSTFETLLNAAVKTYATAVGDVAWFQYTGADHVTNTYVVENNTGNGETSFNNGTDSVVKLAGLVDLSHATLNITSGTGSIVLH
jgi:S-layer protein